MQAVRGICPPVGEAGSPALGPAGRARSGGRGCGSRKPVPAVLAHLQLLFQSVGLVGKAPSFRSDNIADDFKGAECFSCSLCPEVALTDILITFLQSCFFGYVT